MPYLVSSRERSYRPNLGCGWGVLKLHKSPESEKKKPSTVPAVVMHKLDKWWIRPSKTARRRSRLLRHSSVLAAQDSITDTGDIGIRHFRNDKGTGAEMCPAIVSGIVTGDALVSPRSLCKSLLAPVSLLFVKWRVVWWKVYSFQENFDLEGRFPLLWLLLEKVSLSVQCLTRSGSWWLLLVCTWRHGGHVGDQEQKCFSPLGTKHHFYEDSSKNCSLY